MSNHSRDQELGGDMVERVARAMQHSPAWPAVFNAGSAAVLARAAIEAMRAMTLVYRQGGQVVHELRGAPDDIWKALLDAVLADGVGLDPTSTTDGGEA